SATAPAAPAAPAADQPTGTPSVEAATLPPDAKVSPVAARIAAVEGVDLSGVAGTGPGGRITKADVLARMANGSAATAPAPETAAPAAPAQAPAPGGTQLPLRGGAGMLARYMDESRSIPTATSFRTITVTTMDGRRKQLKDAGLRVSFTHLIAYAIALAAQN